MLLHVRRPRWLLLGSGPPRGFRSYRVNRKQNLSNAGHFPGHVWVV